MKLLELTKNQKEDVMDRFYDAMALGDKKRKIIKNLQEEYELTYNQIWYFCKVYNTKLIRRRNG